MPPDPRTEYYFSLRSAADGELAAGAPEWERDGVARLRRLLEFLPDSLPLRTPANTVLILYRKNPRHTQHFERLLWRRLDPLVAGAGPRDDLSGALGRMAEEMRPLCGPKADTLAILARALFDAGLPGFQRDPWPARKLRLEAWRGAIESRLGPHREEATARLASDLGLPANDSLTVRVLLGTRTTATDGMTLPTGPGSIVVVLSPVDGEKPGDLARLLRAVGRGADAFGSAAAPTARQRLVQGITERGGDPKLASSVAEGLVHFTVESVLHELFGETAAAAAGRNGATPPAWAAHEKMIAANWRAYREGGLTLEAACQTTAAAVVTRPAVEKHP
jgi:hypothetical protein